MGATRDTTGDGVVDQWGFAGSGDTLVVNLMHANDAYQVTPDRQFGLDSPNAMVVWEWLDQLYRVDRSWNDSSTDWTEQNRNQFRRGEVAMSAGAFWTMVGPAARIFDYDAVPWPIGPNNTTGTNGSKPFESTFAYPRGVPHDFAGAIFNVVYEAITGWYGDDFELRDDPPVWETSRFNRIETYHRIVYNINNHYKQDWGDAIPGYYFNHSVVPLFHAGTHTPAQAIEQFKPERVAILNDFFGR
jgi:hypothetical protein